MLDAWTETWLAPAFAAWTLDADLARVRARVRCPLLALHGNRDEYGSGRHPERIGTRAAGPSEVVILEGCGHVPQREQPETVLRAVARFLAVETSTMAETAANEPARMSPSSASASWASQWPSTSPAVAFR